MLTWAVVAACLLGVLTYLVGDVTVVLANLAELVAVIAVFALVCASDAWT